MPRKTKKQKKQAAQRRKDTQTSTSVKKKKDRAYKPSEYDTQLRVFTLKDTTRTIVVTLILVALQVAIFYAYNTGFVDQFLQ